jgi:endonuclease YncB( thermonuclease family)
MFDPVEIFWTPAGARIPHIGTKAFVDVTDGDTPNIRMPVRMLSVDTPEVTADTEIGARKVDEKFKTLAVWIREGRAPISRRFADHILPKIETGAAGTLQFNQGRAASAWFKQRIEERLRKPNGDQRNLFVSTSEAPFDTNHRLLAYIAPSYTARELDEMSRKDRATFNLDLVESGWAAPFVVFPNIPGELDLPMFLEAASAAANEPRGQYIDPLSLPAYEYRMCEKLFSITKKIVEGERVSNKDRFGWRSRYAADMRDRKLYGPEDYMGVPGLYRIWIWPDDVQRAIGALNLVPSPQLVA